MTSSNANPIRPPGLVTECTATYHILRSAMGLYMKLRYRLKIDGLEHLPKTGAALIVANHQSYVDIPLLAYTSRRHIAFVARSTLAESSSLAFIMRECGAIQINRGGGDRAGLREMVQRLDDGGLVAMFPEGTRTRDGRVGEFKRGALMAARKAGVPIVPAAIRGSGGVLPRGASGPRPGRLSVQFLPARSAEGSHVLEQLQADISAVVGDGRCVGGPAV